MDRQDACSHALSESMLTAAALKTQFAVSAWGDPQPLGGKCVEVMQTMHPPEAWGGGLGKGEVKTRFRPQIRGPPHDEPFLATRQHSTTRGEAPFQMGGPDLEVMRRVRVEEGPS